MRADPFARSAARTAPYHAERIRRWVVLGLSALLFAGAWAGSGPVRANDLLSPAERAWLAAHPRIVLGAGEDWAPYIVRDLRGGLSGFGVEYIELLNRKLGTNIQLEVGPWHEIVARAERREIDGLTLTAPVPERAAHFAFTDAFVTAHDFVFLRTGDLQKRDLPRGLDALRGQRVGYLKGTVRISRELEKFKSITAVPANGYADLAQKLLLGEVDAAISAYTLEVWRVNNGFQGIAPAHVLRQTESRLVMSVRRDWPELVGILNKGLAAIDRNEVEPLYRRWFGAAYLARTATFGATFSTEELAWIAAHPVIRVGIDPEWAPVEFVDSSGVARGMSLAYLDRLGTALGLRFEVVKEAGWTEVMRRLSAREIDLVPAIAETPERRETMRFTEPYLSFPAAIFSAADVAYLGGPEALIGKSVAVVAGEAVESWLRSEWPEIRMVSYRDTREALRAVARGDAYAFVGNLVTTSYYIGQSGLTQIKVAGETPFRYRLGMAVRTDWPELAQILQKAIDSIPATERDAIYQDWIAIRYEHAVDYRLLWLLGAAASLVLLLVVGERVLAMRRANARLGRLARELSIVEEKERRRLAGELHDSPMQKLALAQMQFGSAGKQVAAEAAEQMETGLGLMREALAELRSLQFELSPPMLHKEGLAPALRWLASHASQRSGVRFSFQGPATPPPLPQDVAVLLFQCARELVYNAAKHASASTATIGLETRDGEILLAVNDDGKGLPGNAANGAPGASGGFGLFSIRERLALFGGQLSISSDAAGTRATIRMPVRAEAGAREGLAPAYVRTASDRSPATP